MTTAGPLATAAARRANYALMRGFVLAGEILPGYIRDAEADLANAAPHQREDAEQAVAILKAAYEKGEWPEAGT